MSAIPQEDEQIVEEAKAEYTAFLQTFEDKHGYGIGAMSEVQLTPEGYLKIGTLMKLVKLPPKSPVQLEETPADTTPNGNDQATETSASDSTEQPAA